MKSSSDADFLLMFCTSSCWFHSITENVIIQAGAAATSWWGGLFCWDSLVQVFDLKEAEAYEKGEDKALASALALGSPITLKGKSIHMEESRKYGATYLPLERDV